MRSNKPTPSVDRKLVKTEMLIQLWQHGWVTPTQLERNVLDALAHEGLPSESDSLSQQNFEELLAELCEHGYARTAEVEGIDVVVAADPDQQALAR